MGLAAEGDICCVRMSNHKEVTILSLLELVPNLREQLAAGNGFRVHPPSPDKKTFKWKLIFNPGAKNNDEGQVPVIRDLIEFGNTTLILLGKPPLY